MKKAASHQQEAECGAAFIGSSSRHRTEKTHGDSID
jgi:hypothetical protein